MAEVSRCGLRIRLGLPVQVSEMTLRITGYKVNEILVDGWPLWSVAVKRHFESGTFLLNGEETLAAFDPGGKSLNSWHYVASTDRYVRACDETSQIRRQESDYVGYLLILAPAF